MFQITMKTCVKIGFGIAIGWNLFEFVAWGSATLLAWVVG